MHYFYTIRFCRGISSLLVFGGFFLVSSCSQYMYSPSAGSIPNLKKSGELNAQASLGIKNPSFGSAIAVQYAPFKNTGIRASGSVSLPSHFTSSFANQNYRLSGSGYYTELGLGRFGFLPHRLNKTEGASIQIYGGLGIGGFTSTVLGDIESHAVRDKANLKFKQAYLQPSVILRHRFFNLGIGLRFGYIHYNQGTFWGDKQMFRSTYQFFEAKNRFVVIEPTIQLWSKPIRDVKIQIFITATSMPVEVATNSIWGLGAQYPLDKKFLSKKQPIFQPFYNPPSLPIPTSRKFSVCKRAP